MKVFVWVPLLGSVVLGLGAPALARRLTPKTTAMTLTGAAVIATACWLYTLGLLAATLAGRIGPLTHLGHWSAEVLQAGDPVSPVVGLLATAALVLVTPVCFTVGVQRTRALLTAERLIRSHRDTVLLVLDDPTPDAYAIGGITGGRIAVSTGMLAALDDAERTALLAHEQAHVAGRHHVLRLATGLAAAINPLLRRLPAIVETATERWADEHAAATTGDRHLVARALSRAALAALRAARGPQTTVPVAAFHRGDVASRVAALLQPPPPVRRRPVALVILLGCAVIAATIGASHDLERLFEHAGRAYLTLR